MRPEVLGGALFRLRGLVPVPLLLAAVLHARPALAWQLGGLGLIALGEGLRLWGVAWIGPRSRTRTAQVGALVEGGPFSRSRNPLYVGNLLMHAGIALMTGRAWWPPLAVGLLALHYSAVVRWEESRLEAALGEAYRDYRGRVPRWWVGPKGEGRGGDLPQALRSERSTFLALGAVLLALSIRIAL